MSKTTIGPRPMSRSVTDRSRRARWGWLALILPVIFIAGLVVADLASEQDAAGGDASALGRSVPDFELETTAGTTMSRAEALSGGDTLFYFSMGPGCAPCFTQIPELKPGLAMRGIRLVSVMVSPADQVAAEAARYGVEDPILIDADRRLSQALDMLGKFGHGDLPTHSFALVDSDGVVRWVRDYPDVLVPAADFFAELDPELE